MSQAWPVARAALWVLFLGWLLLWSLQESNGAYIGGGILVWAAWFWRD